MADCVEAKGLNFSPFAEFRHKVQALLEGLTVLVSAESRLVLTDEDMRGIRNRPILPPPAPGILSLDHS